MIDTYSGIEYDEFCVIRKNDWDDNQVFNKLQMFDLYRDGQNIYFDLDVVIKGDCNHFLRKDLHVCHAWWREAWHTPLNSSIISWQGDHSRIYENFMENPDMYMMQYYKGIDQYLWEIYKPMTYKEGEGVYSYQFDEAEQDLPVCLFNQRYEFLKDQGWWSRYQLPQLHKPQLHKPQ